MKYHNQKTTYDGITFDSSKEAKRYAELKLLERGKAIKDLKRQVPFVLLEACTYPSGKKQRQIKYIADFVYYRRSGNEWERVVEDVKGFKTDVYKLKKAMMYAEYGIEILET